MVGRIYKEDHYTLYIATYKIALGLVVLEENFYAFPVTPPRGGACMDPRARLAGFIKRTTIHCYTQNMKALGHVVLE